MRHRRGQVGPHRVQGAQAARHPLRLLRGRLPGAHPLHPVSTLACAEGQVASTSSPANSLSSAAAMIHPRARTHAWSSWSARMHGTLQGRHGKHYPLVISTGPLGFDCSCAGGRPVGAGQRQRARGSVRVAAHQHQQAHDQLPRLPHAARLPHLCQPRAGMCSAYACTCLFLRNPEGPISLASSILVNSCHAHGMHVGIGVRTSMMKCC